MRGVTEEWGDCITFRPYGMATILFITYCECDAWNDVCNNAVVTDSNGVTFSLWQDGDLWLVPTSHEWEDY